MKLKIFFLLIIFLNVGCASNYKVRPVKNWKEMREENVSMQKFDFSCGTGSLATLMKFYFGDDVSEETLIKDIFNFFPEYAKNNRKEKGLSLLDLKQAAERRGYQAYGVTLKPISLYKMGRPVLVYLETNEFKHFSVFRGIREDRVFLADPSRGNIRISADRFLQEWKGRLALVFDKTGFNASKNHALSLEKNDEMFFRGELLAARKALFFKP
ncbi:MAG: cysteine peptidase family C39 domain-containing protein [Patescibacteria group bacterium]